jgi:hypothetical protein
MLRQFYTFRIEICHGSKASDVLIGDQQVGVPDGRQYRHFSISQRLANMPRTCEVANIPDQERTHNTKVIISLNSQQW